MTVLLNKISEPVDGFPPYVLVVLQIGWNYLYSGGQVGSTHFNGRPAMFAHSLDIPNYMLSTLDGGRQTLQHKVTSKLEWKRPFYVLCIFTFWVLQQSLLKSKTKAAAASSIRTLGNFISAPNVLCCDGKLRLLIWATWRKPPWLLVSVFCQYTAGASNYTFSHQRNQTIWWLPSCHNARLSTVTGL